MPKISVVMPVYNSAPFLRQSIESVLNQTFTDFELLIINDASTDDSLEIIKSYSDPRIKLIENEENLGLSAVRNKAIKESVGEYIAFLDSDDYAFPERLNKQVVFLDSHPEVGVCGSRAVAISENKKPKTIRNLVQDSGVLRCIILFTNPLITSTVMLRGDILKKYNLFFDNNFPPTEDYDLWERFSRYTKLYNLSSKLVYYRFHSGQTSKNLKKEEQLKLLINQIQSRQFTTLGIILNDSELGLLFRILGGDNQFPNTNYVEVAAGLLIKIIQANKITNVYDQKSLEKALGLAWYMALSRNLSQSLKTIVYLFKYRDLSKLMPQIFLLKLFVKLFSYSIKK